MNRQHFLEVARAEIGLSDPIKYWSNVLVNGEPPPTLLPMNFHQHRYGHAYPPEWSEAFILWCLREAGLTRSHWDHDKGFLWQLPRTTDPKSGDIGSDGLRHFIVSEIGGQGLVSIGGNSGSSGVQELHRAMSPALEFCSIENLLLSSTESTCDKGQSS